jgi:CubicO group peptidase (beta-lactamase class C family)
VKPVLLAMLMTVAGAAAAAPDEAALGKAEGYPVCALWYGMPQDRCQVGMLSHFDTLAPARKVPKAEAPRAFKRAPAELAGAREFMEGNRNTGLLVLRGDTILAERYQYDRNENHRFYSFSMAKTVVAMLVGIALAEGKIKSIDDLAGQYVPELKQVPYGQTSLRHLLTMSSGVAFTERYDGRDDVMTLSMRTLRQQGPGGAHSVLEFKRRERPAGEKFSYASGDTQALGLVLRAAVGQPLAEYLAEKIWRPMGAEADATWIMDAGGYELGYVGISATLRDWGRLGLLLADGGAREGRQIIPADWIKAATTTEAPHLKVGVATRNNGYGYQTWLIDHEGRFALMGVRGQGVFVDPKTRTVIVHTAVHSEFAGARERGPQFRFFFEVLRALN